MCGIFFSCSEKDHCHPSEALLEILQKRGPDGVSTSLRMARFGPTAAPGSGFDMQMTTTFLTFVSTVLSLRGDTLVSQPLEDPSSGSLLCWNGEAWKTSVGVVQGNDAEVIFRLFLDATQTHNDGLMDNSFTSEDKLQNLTKHVANIAGPFAFLFYDAPNQRVLYGRDALGRRSLLVKRYSLGGLTLCSVSDSSDCEEWEEVEADGIYMLDLRAGIDSPPTRVYIIDHIPWVMKGLDPDYSRDLVQKASTNVFPNLKIR